MFASSLFGTPAGLLRRATSLLALTTVFTLAACGDDDDDDDGFGPGGDITGTWTAEEGGVTEYVRITANTVEFYSDLGGDCFLTVEAEIVSRDGNEYTIDFEGETDVVEITRSGDQLTVENGTESFVYTRSSVNVDNLEICTGTPDGEFEPDLATCSSLPTLDIDDVVAGSLTTGDDLDPNGYRYDQYRIQLGASANVRIDLGSDDIDSYLYLFSSGGNLITSDDDGGDVSLASRITESLSAGCYIVVASSYDPGELGDYMLGFTTF